MRPYQTRINDAVLKALGRVVANHGGNPDEFLILSWGYCEALTGHGFQFKDLIVKTNGKSLSLGDLELKVTIDQVEVG